MARRGLAVAALALAAWPSAAAATQPGRNGLLAASAEVLGSNTSVIYVGKRDGSRLRALPSPCPPGPLDPAALCHAATPAWSPDGGTVAFTVVRPSDAQVWLVDADGSDLRPVPSARGYSPTWSPDGRTLAFSADDPSGACGLRNVYIVGADGSGLQLLARRGDHPDWSSRGEVAFTRLREVFDPGTGESCWSGRAVGGVRPGTPGIRTIVRRGIDPSWAPRGFALAFQRGKGIYRVRAGGEGVRLLVDRTRFLEGPAWSPDGRLIAYRDLRRTRAIRARRGRSVPVRFDPPGTAYSPAWQPLPD
jgi:dipeptidyl aminopeptidase/acylaminoacyl peptidase